VLFGDGSGNTVEGSCGWAVTLLSPLYGRRKVLVGGASSGTNNYAELMPYVHALWHLHNPERIRGPPNTFF
jgi:ribonuclease HI